mmetsp:Transcript_2973/g.5157  ORF Transcript_2973/g.5157 Transcript_2973/m.5157 type:complete len:94 (-) Transcript_2973:83-364(-)
MALRSATVILPLGVIAAFLMLAPAFLPVGKAAPSLRAPAAASASGAAALIAAAPLPAHAFSETELNQFGLVFAIFFLGFFVAGLVRMFNVGKL